MDVPELPKPKGALFNLMAQINFGSTFVGMIFTTALLIRRLMSTSCIKNRGCRCCVMNKKVEDVVQHTKLDKKAAALDNDLMDDILGLLRKRVSKSAA